MQADGAYSVRGKMLIDLKNIVFVPAIDNFKRLIDRW